MLFQDLILHYGLNAEILQQYGFYVCANNENNEMTISDSDGGIVETNSAADVKIDTPSLTYDVTNKTWKISSKIAWKNAAWNTQNLGVKICSKGGALSSVGGNDMYRFEFSNVTKDYSSLNITRMSASAVHNEVEIFEIVWFSLKSLGKKTVTKDNVNSASSQLGVIFETQDSMITVRQDMLRYDYTFDAKTISMVTTFNSNLSKLGGNVSAFYHHNYNKTSVSEVKVGIGAESDGKVSGKVEFTMTKEKHFWTGYSGGQVAL